MFKILSVPAIGLAFALAAPSPAAAGELATTGAFCTKAEDVRELVGTNMPSMRELFTDNTGRHWMLLADRETGALIIGWLDLDEQKFCSTGARNGIGPDSQG